MPYFTWLVILTLALVAIYFLYARPGRAEEPERPSSRRSVALDQPLDAARDDHELAREIFPDLADAEGLTRRAGESEEESE